VRDLSNKWWAKPLANRFRLIVSGSQDGRPDWVSSIAEGDDEGLFGPESAVWKIHGSLATLLGGIRALLLQAAHPAPRNGVIEHSRYKSDPLGRLAGTTRWLTLTTFASKSVIAREASRVNAMHSAVEGEFQGRDGQSQRYRASDHRYLLWVHCAFTDSFLKSYQALEPGIRPRLGDLTELEGAELADAYVKEWALSAIPLGLVDAPQSLAELEETLEEFRRSELHLDAQGERVIEFILNPPFSALGKFFYSLLAGAAISTLDPRDRELLGLKRPRPYYLKLSKFSLKVLSAMLGHRSPSEKVARERIERVRRRT
jgi:uncharacterized protein (DUF2236 family)